MPDRSVECAYNTPPSSVAAPASVTAAITGITAANPGVVTANGHGFQNGDLVAFSAVGGMTQINALVATVASATANTFATGINTSGFSAYTTGGVATKIQGVGAAADVRVLYKDTLSQDRVIDALTRVREALTERFSAS
jgi:hypothetical protein